jgi:hypothetical protein
MRLLGFLSTYFGAVWLIVPGSVMAMAYRSHKGRRDVESLHNGTLVREALVVLGWRNCRNMQIGQTATGTLQIIVEELIETRPAKTVEK